MQILRSKVDFIRLPLTSPLRTAAGKLTTFETVILTLESAAAKGRAEAPITVLPDADLPRLADLLEHQIMPILTNRSISDSNALREALGKWARNPLIYAMTEMAWFDLLAAEKNQPLCRVLGGEPISQQVFTSLDEPENDADGYPMANEFLDRVQKLYRAGYVHLELKVRPGWDVPMVRAVRQENPDASFHLDFEGALTTANYDTIFQLRDFFPFMLEQAFAPDQLCEHAELQKMLVCPICLDESVTSPGIVEAALKLGSVKTVKINPLRAGGFESAKEILAICRDAGADCWISSPLATGVSVRACLAFSCLEGFTGPFESYDLLEHFAPDQLSGIEMPPALTLDEEHSLRIE